MHDHDNVMFSILWQSKDGNTALVWAIRSINPARSAEVVAMLLEHGADPTIPSGTVGSELWACDAFCCNQFYVFKSWRGS